MGKVQDGKLTVKFHDLCVSDPCGLFRTVKTTEIVHTIIFPNISNPSSVLFMKMDADKTTGIASSAPHIVNVLRPRALAKILFAVVQPIMVDMVDFFKDVIENVLMHQTMLAIDFPSRVSGSSAKLSLPIPLRYALKIIGINYCDKAARERDVTVRWVGWLSNKMSFNATFWHVPTFNRNLRLSHFSMEAD